MKTIVVAFKGAATWKFYKGNLIVARAQKQNTVYVMHARLWKSEANVAADTSWWVVAQEARPHELKGIADVGQNRTPVTGRKNIHMDKCTCGDEKKRGTRNNRQRFGSVRFERVMISDKNQHILKCTYILYCAKHKYRFSWSRRTRTKKQSFNIYKSFFWVTYSFFSTDSWKTTNMLHSLFHILGIGWEMP